VCSSIQLFSPKLMQTKEARKKVIDDMDPKTKEAFENIKFYKFYPVKTPYTPDVSNVKVCGVGQGFFSKQHLNLHLI
jgi:hypothetical protein